VRQLEKLWSLVAEIPAGRCTTYGRLGRALDPPVSGLLVGRWMAQSPPGVPWWRVVARDGRIAIARRGPEWGAEQRDRLAAEGVPFDGERVALDRVFWEP
jgi:methylated-DNA-protein-cysteine methyltransferase related protein